MKTATSSPLVPVDVAVGIVRQPTGEMLLARRPVDKPYAGYWEFPGGKIEASESIFTALQRELMEELGIQISTSLPWCCLTYRYPHAHVRLHVHLISAWQGTPQSLENQELIWQSNITAAPLLPATVLLVKWLNQTG